MCHLFPGKVYIQNILFPKAILKSASFNSCFPSACKLSPTLNKHTAYFHGEYHTEFLFSFRINSIRQYIISFQFKIITSTI